MLAGQRRSTVSAGVHGQQCAAGLRAARASADDAAAARACAEQFKQPTQLRRGDAIAEPLYTLRRRRIDGVIFTAATCSAAAAAAAAAAATAAAAAAAAAAAVVPQPLGGRTAPAASAA